MWNRIQDSAIGALFALVVAGAIVSLLWKPYIVPQLNTASKDAGKGFIAGLVESIRL